MSRTTVFVTIGAAAATAAWALWARARRAARSLSHPDADAAVAAAGEPAESASERGAAPIPDAVAAEALPAQADKLDPPSRPLDLHLPALGTPFFYPPPPRAGRVRAPALAVFGPRYVFARALVFFFFFRRQLAHVRERATGAGACAWIATRG